MLISKLKNSGPKLTCTGPGPTNTRDEVMVTGEFLGCTRTQVILDSSHHNNHHAPSVSPYPQPVSAAVSWSCRVVSTRHVSRVSGRWPVLTIGRNNTDPESINRDTTNTHWPLNITNIHSLAILWQKYTIILWHNITFQLVHMPNICISANLPPLGAYFMCNWVQIIQIRHPIITLYLVTC